MEILRKEQAPRYIRDLITSYLLVSDHTCGSRELTVTMVEMAPGGIQRPHSHQPEQMYYILEGIGVMSVGGERREVGAGDCIYFPSRAEHGLENTGQGPLRYLSAASPSFGLLESKELWPLGSIDDSRKNRPK